jgi:hypothetical protein
MQFSEYLKPFQSVILQQSNEAFRQRARLALSARNSKVRAQSSHTHLLGHFQEHDQFLHADVTLLGERVDHSCQLVTCAHDVTWLCTQSPHTRTRTLECGDILVSQEVFELGRRRDLRHQHLREHSSQHARCVACITHDHTNNEITRTVESNTSSSCSSFSARRAAVAPITCHIAHVSVVFV